MCGINGYQGTFPDLLISEMNQSIIHRGPDYQDTIKLGNTSLGHVRLSIQDLSPLSNQPMASKCGQYEIVFNGEIYNFKELRSKLVDSGVLFRSNGDTEVLLELWARHQEKCLEMLDGIFAFAVHDKHSETLTLVRDHFGVKPLYYSECEAGFIFSSELKAILQSEQVSRDLNYSAIASALSLLWQAGSQTTLKHVLKLAPGSLLEVKKGKITKHTRFYSAPSYRGTYDLDTAQTELEQSLVTAVNDQLVADVEVGAFLSGGLDSSLVCAIAKENSENFNKVYSIEIDPVGIKKEGLTDDLPFAKAVAELLALNLETVQASSDICTLLPECIYHLDEPQADPAIINTFLICQKARQAGIKVLLSGAGGDDIFTGYRRHYAAYLDQRLGNLPSPIKSLASGISRILPSQPALSRRLGKFLASFDKSDLDKLVSYYSWLPDDDVLKLFSKKCRNDNTIQLPKAILQSHLGSGSANNVEDMLRIEKEFFLVDHNFNYTDKMSMAHGVEVRVPLVTRKLMDVAANIPTRFKQKGRVGKWILKKVATRWLPNNIIYRPKTGFAGPLRSWLHGPLAPLVSSVLSQSSIERRGIFNFEEIQTLIEDDRSGKRDASYTIFALISLEIWLRQFVDQSRPRSLSFADLVK